jgi:hypothetical protein
MKPTQALSLLAVGRRFCGTPSCEVVYYGEDGRAVTKSEIPIRARKWTSERPSGEGKKESAPANGAK